MKQATICICARIRTLSSQQHQLLLTLSFSHNLRTAHSITKLLTLQIFSLQYVLIVEIKPPASTYSRAQQFDSAAVLQAAVRARAALEQLVRLLLGTSEQVN